jgi:phosphoribosylaminoimidazole-succinocarboxamide synthase
MLRLELDRQRMFRKNISMDDIAFVLRQKFGEAISLIYSDYNTQRLIMRIRIPPVAVDETGMDDMIALTLRINDFLTGLLLGVGITLVDFKLEFGRLYENDEMRIVLADEISPDNCRLWDSKTGEKMDKDRFRRDLGRVEEGYQEVARRLGILPEAGVRDLKGPETVQ